MNGRQGKKYPISPSSPDPKAVPVGEPADAQTAEHESGAEESTPQTPRVKTPVVGIGASAGGLEALKDFFGTMPTDSGMAFVIVQHLEPTHESRMAEILAKYTTMQVRQAEDGMLVEPNAVYTYPPGRTLSIHEGRLSLGTSTQRGHVWTPIDHFLSSLAEDYGSQAICIILSGSSGSDGPRGVRAVRAAGGMCMVQDPTSAQFPAMPQAVIDTGLVDYILAPVQMPTSLLEFTNHPHVRLSDQAEPQDATAASDLEAIVKFLRAHTTSDYSHYRRTTVYRRIQRRMGLRQIAGMDEYLKLLQRDAEEMTQLAKDMLIGVSAFFRDAEVFESLRSEVIVPLVQARPDDAPLRMWVAGCATGEEAYSIAMLLLEARTAAGKSCPLQIFATDVDEQSLETARAGLYPLSIEDDVPAHRLEAFFTKQGQNYRVDKHLREAVVFSRHNLLADPPFSKLDLISCRNVLIYIEPEAQKKILSVFSFALNLGGCLMLGRAEGITNMENVFEPVSKHDRIYRLIRSNRRVAGEFPLYSTGRTNITADRDRAVGNTGILPQANLDAMLRHFDASIVLVDPEGAILYFHGQTEKYLGHPKGSASLNILDMTSGTLSVRLRRAINRALEQNEPVNLMQIALPRENASLVNLTVMRVDSGAGVGVGKILAIIFEDAQPSQRPETSQLASATDEPMVVHLAEEVKSLRTELRTNAEGYDVVTEELKAANEEVMSMNEELQSANEELEASKEELQSVNEELTTVNAQLNDKVGELVDTNNDLVNLLRATEIATIFLDGDLRIRRFTPRATALLNLIDADVGRPVGHITQNFSGVDLASDAHTVLKSLTSLEREVQGRDGTWYTVRILPYRTLDDRIDGIVITFSDVTRLKQTEQHLRYEKTYTEKIIQTVRRPLLVLDGQLRVLSANAAFYENFQISPDDTMDRRIFELGDGQWDIPQLRSLLEEVIPKESAFKDFRVECKFEKVGRKVMLVSGRRIEPTGNLAERLLLTIEDITEREKDRLELGALNVDLEKRVAERTALAERRSDQLRQLAMELTRSEQRERERLARILHDDLQQLLVGAKLQLATVRSYASDKRATEAVAFMDNLLKQSLDASRGLTVELSPTILQEAGLDAALPWLGRQMEERHHLKVEVQINAAVEHDEEGVAFLLFSAVRELLLNVAKHANVDSARVQMDRLEGDRVRIVVSDKGKGFRVTSSAGQDTATGLGLFGLQERLEHVGGQCVIDSAPGRGTRVTLTAKVGTPKKTLRKAKAATQANQHLTDAPGTAKPAGDKIRVLLVDDHVLVRQGLAGILNDQKDMEVIAEASDGLQAVQQASRHRPDVVIMDISMPGINGIEATKAILAELPGMKIIGLSIYVEADRAEAMQQAGAVGYVSKGGPSEILLDAIRTAAGRPAASKQ